MNRQKPTSTTVLGGSSDESSSIHIFLRFLHAVVVGLARVQAALAIRPKSGDIGYRFSRELFQKQLTTGVYFKLKPSFHLNANPAQLSFTPLAFSHPFSGRRPKKVATVLPAGHPRNYKLFQTVKIMEPLAKEEYIEQAYLFRGLNNRLDESDPVQVVMKHLRDEILTTTKLPMAIDFILSELTRVGTMSTAMQQLAHYFSGFQTFVMATAEEATGRMDMRVALLILECEAGFRAENVSQVAMFLFQFETICENHLDYDDGLAAMTKDPVYDAKWRDWIKSIRRKIGMVGIADLIYVHSEHYQVQQEKIERSTGEVSEPTEVLFGDKEGRIALANRNKDPKYLFAALQRQIGYPEVPKPKPADKNSELLPKLLRQMERMETRMKMLEDENRSGGIDLKQFYQE